MGEIQGEIRETTQGAKVYFKSKFHEQPEKHFKEQFIKNLNCNFNEVAI